MPDEFRIAKAVENFGTKTGPSELPAGSAVERLLARALPEQTKYGEATHAKLLLWPS